jgi:hypothetical protein
VSIEVSRVRGDPGVKVECLSCRHVGVLSDTTLARLKIKPSTPIAAFVKRLRCSRCSSQSVRARREVLPVRKAV